MTSDDDGGTKCLGTTKVRTDSVELFEQSLTCDLDGSFAFHGLNDEYEQSMYLSVLEPLEDEDNEEGLERDNTVGERRRLTDPSSARPPRGPSGPNVLRARSDHHRLNGSSSLRAAPRRGLSASCSMMNFDGSFSNCGTQLSREKSKLCKLSSQSGHHRGDDNSAPSRTIHRRRSSKSVISTSSEDSFYDGGSSVAQLHVGDLVMLGNKEASSSLHLRRRMPPRGKPCDDLEDGENSSEEQELGDAHLDALKA